MSKHWHQIDGLGTSLVVQSKIVLNKSWGYLTFSMASQRKTLTVILNNFLPMWNQSITSVTEFPKLVK